MLVLPKHIKVRSGVYGNGVDPNAMLVVDRELALNLATLVIVTSAAWEEPPIGLSPVHVPPAGVELRKNRVVASSVADPITTRDDQYSANLTDEKTPPDSKAQRLRAGRQCNWYTEQGTSYRWVVTTGEIKRIELTTRTLPLLPPVGFFWSFTSFSAENLIPDLRRQLTLTLTLTSP